MRRRTRILIFVGLAALSAMPCCAAHVSLIAGLASSLDATTWQYDYAVSLVSGDPIDTWYLLSEDLAPLSVTTPDGWTWAATDTPFNYIMFITGTGNGAPGDNPIVDQQPFAFSVVSSYAPADSLAITQDVNWEFNSDGYVAVTAPAIPPQEAVPEAGTLALGTLGLLSLIRRRKTG